MSDPGPLLLSKLLGGILMWAGGSRPKEPTGPDADPHNTSRLNTTRGSPIIQTAATAAKGGGCGRLAGDCGTLMLPFFINNFKGSIEHTKPGIAQGQEIPLSSSSLDSAMLLRKLEKEVGTEAAARQSLPAARRASLLHRVIFAPAAELPFVDIPEIRRAATLGVPDDLPLVRAMLWLVLLGVLPPDRSQWKAVLEVKTAEYDALVTQVLHGSSGVLRLRSSFASGGVAREVVPESTKDDTEQLRRVCSRMSADAKMEDEPAGTAAMEHPEGEVEMEMERLLPTPSSHEAMSRAAAYIEKTRYRKDLETLSTIHKDVSRTLSELHFFSSAENANGGPPAENPASAAAKDQSFKAVQELLDVLESESLLATARGVGGLADGDMDAKAGPPDASGPLGHELQLLTARGRDKLVAIRRGLFVFAKTQVHIGYTQGMNEILAALFYVFDNGLSHRAPSGPLEGLKTTAEALSYWAFKEVIVEFKSNFAHDLDVPSVEAGAPAGLAAQMRMMMPLLQAVDPPLCEHLTSLGVSPTFYAIKWFGTLLTQTLVLPDLIRFWDTLWSVESGDRQTFFVAATVACVLVANNEGLLVYNDFADIMRNLQRGLQVPDVDVLSRIAYLIFCKHHHEMGVHFPKD